MPMVFAALLNEARTGAAVSACAMLSSNFELLAVYAVIENQCLSQKTIEATSARYTDRQVAYVNP